MSQAKTATTLPRLNQVPRVRTWRSERGRPRCSSEKNTLSTTNSSGQRSQVHSAAATGGSPSARSTADTSGPPTSSISVIDASSTSSSTVSGSRVIFASHGARSSGTSRIAAVARWNAAT